MNQLTVREQEILQLIGQGLTNREIALRLSLALSTVKWYVRKLYKQLGVNNREEAIAWGARHDIVQPRPAHTILHSLPVALTPFIGRQAELAQLDHFFHLSEARLVTLIATGGMGKSRLALAWGEQQLQNKERFPDGVFFVSLAPILEPSQIASSINQTLGLFPERDDQRSADVQLVDYLQQRKLLLILDNFEHLLDGATLLSKILHGARSTSILVTSRERLRLYGEQLLRIEGLAYPTDLTELDQPDRSNHYPAVDLFLRSAQRFQPELKLSAETFPHILKICELVEGMPLGLELAAAWIDTIPIADIAQQLSQGYGILESDMRDVPERQRSIWTVFEGTWRQLNRSDQLKFAKLSVLTEGFTNEAADRVADCTQLDLKNLIDRSLVHDQGLGWYKLHQLLRQFGADKLAENEAEKAATHQAHAEFYMGLLAQLTPDLFTNRQYVVLDKIERRFKNIKQGWDWCARQQDWEQLEASTDGLGYFCSWRGYFKDGFALFSQLATLTQTPRGLVWLADFTHMRGGTTEAEGLLEDVFEQLTDEVGRESQSVKALACHQKGWLIFGHNAEEGRQVFQQSLDLYQGLNDEWGQAQASFGLGRVLHDLGEFDAALSHYTTSLNIRKGLGDRRGQALLLNWMSNTAVYQGRDAEGVLLSTQSVALCRELGEKLLLTNSLARLGANLVWQGRYVEAQKLQTEALDLYKQMGNRAKLPRAYTRLSVTEMGVGDLPAARSHAQIGLELAKKVDDQTVAGFALWVLGYIELMETADMSAGYALFKESAEINREVGQKSEMCWSIGMMGYTAECLDKMAESKAHYIEALQIALEIQDFFGLLQGMMGVVFWLAKAGDFERAVDVYGLVTRYPMLTSTRWHEMNAAKRFEEVTEQIPADQIAESLERGRTLELGATAVQLLKFLVDTPA